MNGYGSGPIIRRVIRGIDWRRQVIPPTRFPISKTIEEQLSKPPTWSVSSLLPKGDPIAEGEVTAKDLHHLLKLSALPAPRSKLEEQDMLRTLASQIHFVKEVQKVDTTNVEPLVAVQDETDQAREESTITLEKLKPWLDREEKVGTNGTIRRQKLEKVTAVEPSWNPFDLGGNKESRRMGKFFFVRKRTDKRKQEAITKA